MDRSLKTYRSKRDFAKTPEPSGDAATSAGGNSFVIQKHAARRLHYDFRLEMNGVLKSWAVPEGPSLVPGDKRLAVHVEDHPLDYGGFEGVIPKGEYGGGTVMLWDRGTWVPEYDPEKGYAKGHLRFQLDGEKLKGGWHLVRMRQKPREKQESWLLIKSEDEAARGPEDPAITEEAPLSVASGRSMDEIAASKDRVWSSSKGETTPETPKLAIDPATIAKAKPGKLPDFVEPCLPTAVETAPAGGDWVHEIKFDGYRVQARIAGGKVTLLTRKGLDWTSRFPNVAEALSALSVQEALVDGEMVVEGEGGEANFTGLVEALKAGSAHAFVYHAFDLLFLDGHDLRGAALTERKVALAAVLASVSSPILRLSEHIDGDGTTIFRHACRLGLEGIVSKKASAPYRSGRVKSWVKIRCTDRANFVIAGFMPSSVDRKAIGALVLGEHHRGRLVASGHVGTGFNAEEARRLFEILEPLRRKEPLFRDESAEAKNVRWVEPQLVGEIEYRGRTGSGLIRHSAWKGLQEECNPASIIRPKEIAVAPEASLPEGVRLTNPSRLLWPEDGVTKAGLADFHMEIADWILPHVVDRPLSLVRAPEGVGKEMFFQKHRWRGLSQRVRSVAIPGDDEPMLAISDVAGLMELVQAGVLEIHPWGAKAESPDKPDRITIDLDPGDDVPWTTVVEAAQEVRQRLADIGLTSFVKTTGGKGLHVVLPVDPVHDWESVKSFAQSLSEAMAGDSPERFTANMAKKVRRGRIYVDYLRNGRGATAVAAYSTRARPGASVSTPLAWEELGPDIKADHFTVQNLPQRLAWLDSDPWFGFFEVRQKLPGAEAPKARVTAKRQGTKRAKSVVSTGVPAENILQLLPDAVVPSKEELVAYWRKVAQRALPHLGNRPLKLVRHVNGTTFYHRGPLPPIPDAVHQIRIEKREGGEGTRLWVDSLDGLLGLVEIGAVELHPWGSKVDDIERPDMLVFDLDPGDGVDWPFLRDTALMMRDLLKEEALGSCPKLTGGKGLHVMVPIEPDLLWDEAHAYCREFAERAAAKDPKRYITSAKENRSGKLFIDWLRNGRGSTAIGAYSPRAREGFPVAVPLEWNNVATEWRPEPNLEVRSKRG